MALNKRIPLLFVKDCGYVPAVLVNAGELIEKHIKTENLFQVQGSTAKVKQLMSILSLQKMPKLPKLHVHDVVEVIKVCLSHLSAELIPSDVMSLLIETNQSQMSDYRSILALFCQTSPLNFAAVHYVMRLLNKINQHSASNKMDARKLATIFVLDILKPLTAKGRDDPQEYEAFRLQRVEKLPYLIMVIEQLILRVTSFKDASIGHLYMNRMILKSKSNSQEMDWKDLGNGDSVSKEAMDEAYCLTERGAQSTPKPEQPQTAAYRTEEYPECGDVSPLGSPSQTLQNRRLSRLTKSPPQAKRRRPLLFKSSNRDQSATKSVDSIGRNKKAMPASPAKSNGAKKSLSIKPKVVSRLKTSPSNKSKFLKQNIFHRKIRKVKRSGNTKDSASKKKSGLCFNQDEELAPWGNPPTDSDDSSVMHRSIRRPRFRKTVSSAESGNSGRVSKTEESIKMIHSYNPRLPSPGKVPLRSPILERTRAYLRSPQRPGRPGSGDASRFPPFGPSRDNAMLRRLRPPPGPSEQPTESVASSVYVTPKKIRPAYPPSPKAVVDKPTTLPRMSPGDKQTLEASLLDVARGLNNKVCKDAPFNSSRNQLFKKHHRHAQMLNSRCDSQKPMKIYPERLKEIVLLFLVFSCLYIFVVYMGNNTEHVFDTVKKMKDAVAPCYLKIRNQASNLLSKLNE